LAFGSACTADAQCESGDCFDFPANGQFCTQACNGTGDGPCPNGGQCNGMGQCKVP
jgi:hypothetical protein